MKPSMTADVAQFLESTPLQRKRAMEFWERRLAEAYGSVAMAQRKLAAIRRAEKKHARERKAQGEE